MSATAALFARFLRACRGQLWWALPRFSWKSLRVGSGTSTVQARLSQGGELRAEASGSLRPAIARAISTGRLRARPPRRPGVKWPRFCPILGHRSRGTSSCAQHGADGVCEERVRTRHEWVDPRTRSGCASRRGFGHCARRCVVADAVLSLAGVATDGHAHVCDPLLR